MAVFLGPNFSEFQDKVLYGNPTTCAATAINLGSQKVSKRYKLTDASFARHWPHN
jgi:hypothetical protein